MNTTKMMNSVSSSGLTKAVTPPILLGENRVTDDSSLNSNGSTMLVSPRLSTTATLPINPKKDIMDSEFVPRLSFPLKLYDMLEEADDKDFANIVSWNAEGDGFMVHDTASFVKNIICSYYNQSKYKSFQRQLSLYGFTRVMNGPKKGLRAHKNFLRGKRDLVRQLKPLTGANAPTASTSKSASAINKARATTIKSSPLPSAVAKETRTQMIRSVSPSSPRAINTINTSDIEWYDYSIPETTMTVVPQGSIPSSTDMTPAPHLHLIANKSSSTNSVPNAPSTVSLEDLDTVQMERSLNIESCGDKVMTSYEEEFSELFPPGTSIGAALPWKDPSQDDRYHHEEDVGSFEGMSFFLTENEHPNNIITSSLDDPTTVTTATSNGNHHHQDPVAPKRPLRLPGLPSTTSSRFSFPTSPPQSSSVTHNASRNLIRPSLETSVFPPRPSMSTTTSTTSLSMMRKCHTSKKKRPILFSTPWGTATIVGGTSNWAK